MKKIAGFIVDKRKIVMSLIMIITVVCAVLLFKVEINLDMTKYLSDDSPMKQGIDIMESDFPSMDSKKTIRVMADDLSEAEKLVLLEKLENIPYVDSVEYKENSEYNIDNHTLFIISTDYEYYSPEEESIERSLKRDFDEYNLEYMNDDTSFSNVPEMVLLLAVVLLFVILILMSPSWIEPVLYMVTIGVAVVINFGTNVFIGSISNITAAIGAILQLVLSMDYSIILVSRFRQEVEGGLEPKPAMKEALFKAFSSISGSALTTVVGMLALCFMSFKIGMDIGIVLAKGVFFSMISVFTFLPGLVLIFNKTIKKTEKKVLHFNMSKVATFSEKFRYPIACLFVVMFVGFYFLQNYTNIVYTLHVEDKIVEVFPTRNMYVLVYDNNDAD